MQRSLRMGGRHVRTTRDFDAEREALISEFNDLMQSHMVQVDQISNDASLSSSEKVFELQYEKETILEARENYRIAYDEINEAETEQYEGIAPEESDEFIADEYCPFDGSLEESSDFSDDQYCSFDGISDEQGSAAADFGEDTAMDY